MGSYTLTVAPIGVKFGMEEGTIEEGTDGPLLQAKLHPYRCDLSPLRGEKPQNRSLSKLNAGRLRSPVKRDRLDVAKFSFSNRVVNEWNVTVHSISKQFTLLYCGNIILGESLFVFKLWFLKRAQCSHCKRCISYSNSVRLSVCPSVRQSFII